MNSKKLIAKRNKTTLQIVSLRKGKGKEYCKKAVVAENDTRAKKLLVGLDNR